MLTFCSVSMDKKLRDLRKKAYFCITDIQLKYNIVCGIRHMLFLPSHTNNYTPVSHSISVAGLTIYARL